MQFSYFQFTYSIFFICLISTEVVLSWDLSWLGITENTYRLQHVSLYFIKAFLSIQHNHLSNSNSTLVNFYPTLIESTWPENLLTIKPKIFPNINAHALTIEERIDCKKILNVKLTDIDEFGKLWVFDTGSDLCSPKILVYDLLQRNKELYRTDCLDFKGEEVTSMKIDPESSKLGFYQVYFTFNHAQYMTVFNLNTKTWQKFHIFTGNTKWDLKSIHIHEFAFTVDQRAYLADENGKLYLANMKNLNNGTELQATLVGNLLGRAKGLITDPRGYLYYYLPQHGAVVRWEPTKELKAEGHDILHFESIPVIQILFGVQGSVWIVTEQEQVSHDHCFRILHRFSASITK